MTLKHDQALLNDISSVLFRMGVITVNADDLERISERDRQASRPRGPLSSPERLRLLEDIEYGAPKKIIPALKRLSQSIQKDDLPFIAHALTDKNARVRKAAAEALGASGLREALPIIERALQKDLNEDVLEALLQAEDSLTKASTLSERVLKTIHRSGSLSEAVTTVIRAQEGGNASLMVHLVHREDFHGALSGIPVVLSETASSGASDSLIRISFTDSRGCAVFKNIGPGSYSLKGRNSVTTAKPAEPALKEARTQLPRLFIPAAADGIVSESVILHLSSDSPHVDCAMTVRGGRESGIFDAEVFVALTGVPEGAIINYEAEWESDRPAHVEGTQKLYNTGECLEGRFTLSGLTIRDIETIAIRFAWDNV